MCGGAGGLGGCGGQDSGRAEWGPARQGQEGHPSISCCRAEALGPGPGPRARSPGAWRGSGCQQATRAPVALHRPVWWPHRTGAGARGTGAPVVEAAPPLGQDGLACCRALVSSEGLNMSDEGQGTHCPHLQGGEVLQGSTGLLLMYFIGD